MDTVARQVLHDEQANVCRSLGSNIHPSSQSRKISIGVMADSKASTRCGAMKGDGAVMPNTERVTSKVGNFTGKESKAEGVTASSKIKQIGGPKAMECSWMSKSFYQKTPTSETNIQANQTSILLVSPGVRDEHDGIGCKAGTQFFSYQTSIFPSNNYKKFDGDTSRSARRKGRNDGTTEEPKAFESDKTKVEDKISRTENKTENLRMKLCQILGTTSSPKTQDTGSHTPKVDEESLTLKQRLDQKENKFVKSRQNSDTIETDSESPGHTCKRPVTRSRSRKKAVTQKQQGKGKSGLISRDAEKHQEKSILSFEEKGVGGRDAFPNAGSSVSLKKKSQGKNPQIGRRKICFTENYTADKLHQDTSKTDPPKHAGVPFSFGIKMGGFSGFLPDYQTKIPQAQKVDQEKEFYQPQTVNNTDQCVELEASENGNQQECRSIPFTQSVAKSQDDFQSPTFQFKTPTLNSPSTTPKTYLKENEASSPASNERTRFSLGSIRNLRTFRASEPDFTTSEQDKSYHMKEREYSIPRKEKPFVIETQEQDGSSDSSSEERNFQGCHQGSRARHPAERKSFAVHPIKRLCKHKGIKFNDTSPASVSSKEIGESDSIDEASEQTQDGFVRAVELFSLELAKLKNKLKLMTSQKSSEILKSVAEDIHFQLQDVHSEIQTDLGKLTNLNKSKRKRLETRFEDQQKQLRLIYDRFKEEVNLHLQDCRSTVEDLEADQIEIKGALEKQRVAHKKLLSQVEEAVGVKLNDAQKKITSTQEMARGKLLQLKHVITMCLKDGILN
ncbi:meiosis-specific protein ASY3 [Cicer arietinum]|uniref:Meiosis-specific protein ASY3 n=1 Tax=Cicer arietinum TaxID=3827 RepID=A0A1S2XX04_CICAR|nr:meiosis-specific protein ASY3 [Cicer arietinum]XP_027189034.1 meiosis-specific protein ASY3 [Cicer arietinum]